jgi:S-adenosylmethionine/arginine decarboxylase-like enzyme
VQEEINKTFHKHLMVRAQTLNPPKDTGVVNQWLKELVDSLNMKILQGPFSTYVNKKGNKGLTGAVLIETSHIAFHVWDEDYPALLQFDLYTCGDLDSEKAIKDINSFFVFDSYEFILFDRENNIKTLQRGNSI